MPPFCPLARQPTALLYITVGLFNNPDAYCAVLSNNLPEQPSTEECYSCDSTKNQLCLKQPYTTVFGYHKDATSSISARYTVIYTVKV